MFTIIDGGDNAMILKGHDFLGCMDIFS